MKILFLTHYYYPHIGGVEKHTHEVAKELIKKGPDVSVLTEKHDKKALLYQDINGVEVIRFKYPRLKIFGLLSVWREIWRNRNQIRSADLIHIHDVFIWYLPFVFLYPSKKVITTFHGWEGEWPIPKINIWFKQLAKKYSAKTVAVGKYIGKYYSIKPDKIIYGGAEENKKVPTKKVKGKIVFVGRLEKDTGLMGFLEDLKYKKYKSVVFVGDGSMAKLCKKYGKVTGFTDPQKYLNSAEYAVPAGYLSYIQAKECKCKIVTYANNPLKEDYWNEIKLIKKFPTWGQIADEYIRLYKFSAKKYT